MKSVIKWQFSLYLIVVSTLITLSATVSAAEVDEKPGFAHSVNTVDDKKPGFAHSVNTVVDEKPGFGHSVNAVVDRKPGFGHSVNLVSDNDSISVSIHTTKKTKKISTKSKTKAKSKTIAKSKATTKTKKTIRNCSLATLQSQLSAEYKKHSKTIPSRFVQTRYTCIKGSKSPATKKKSVTKSAKKHTTKKTITTKKTTTKHSKKLTTTKKKPTTTTKELYHYTEYSDSNDDDYSYEKPVYEEPTTTIASTTVSAAAVSSVAAPSTTINQVTLQAVENQKAIEAAAQNKVIGISIGAVVGCLAAAGLAGMFIFRYKNKSEERDPESDGEVQTRWRTQSFMAVVSGAVSKLPKRTNSSGSTVSHNSVMNSIRRVASNASRSLSRSNSSSRSSTQSYGMAVSGPIPAIVRVDGDQAQYFTEPSGPAARNYSHAY